MHVLLAVCLQTAAISVLAARATTAPEEKPCEVAAARRATAEPQVRFNAIAPANVPVPCAFECLRPRANPITRPITGLEASHGANEHG